MNKVEKVNVVSGILMLASELSFLIMMGFMTYNANQINSGILSGYSQVSYEDVGRLLGTNGLLLSLGYYLLYPMIGFTIAYILTLPLHISSHM